MARKELIHSGELEEIVKMGRKIGMSLVRTNFPVPIGRLKESENQILNQEEREQVHKLLRYGMVRPFEARLSVLRKNTEVSIKVFLWAILQ